MKRAVESTVESTVESGTRRPLSTLAPARGPWNSAAAGHLARRALFGCGPERLQELLELGPKDAAATLVADARAVLVDPQLAAAEALGTRAAVEAHWMARILAPDSTPVGRGRLAERIALLWHNHFATSVVKVEDSVLMLRQIDTLRRTGAGDARAMLRSMVQDGAMLVWLDGDGSRPPTPNENLARELMELFALGRGNYSESDVKEAARALTGWSVRGRHVEFAASRHDSGDKNILGARAPFDALALASHLSEQPHFARRVAHRLVRELLTDGGDEQAEAVLEQELHAQDFDVLGTVQALFASELFYDLRWREAKVAGPVEYLARCSLALGVFLPPFEVAQLAARAGQRLFAPPTVEGWRGGADWMHGSALLVRREAAWALAQRAASSPALRPEGELNLSDVWIRLHPGAPAAVWLDKVASMASTASRRERDARRILELLDAPQTHLM